MVLPHLYTIPELNKLQSFIFDYYLMLLFFGFGESGSFSMYQIYVNTLFLENNYKNTLQNITGCSAKQNSIFSPYFPIHNF